MSDTANIARSVIADAATESTSAATHDEAPRIYNDPTATPQQNITRSIAAAEVVKADPRPFRINRWGDVKRTHDTAGMSLSKAAALDEIEALEAAEARGLDYFDMKDTIKQHHNFIDFANDVRRGEGRPLMPANADITPDQVVDAIMRFRESQR